MNFILKQDGTCHDVFKVESPTTILSLGWYENDGVTLTKKGIEQMYILKNNEIHDILKNNETHDKLQR